MCGGGGEGGDSEDTSDSYGGNMGLSDTEVSNASNASSNTADGKGQTNVSNVGPDSNVSYSPQFSANVAQSQGLDPSVSLSPADYSMTTQGKAAAEAQATENFSLDQATNNTNVMGNQVQGVSRGMSPGQSMAMFGTPNTSNAYSASLNDKEDTLGVLGPGVMSQIEALSVQPTTMTNLGMPPGVINSLLSVVENRARDSIMSDLATGKYSAITDSRGNITGTRDSFGQVHSGMDMNVDNSSAGSNGDGPDIIRTNPSDLEEFPIADHPMPSGLASDYMQNPYYLYSGMGNQYQPYGYAQNTLVDLLRTRNMIQPQQRAANLGLFGNPGDFS